MRVQSQVYNHGQSALQLMIDMRFAYAITSSGLILVGFFWNNLQEFSLQYILLIVGIFMANVFMFVVNDFYDAFHDAKDPVKRERNVFCSADTKKIGEIMLYASLGSSLLLGAVISLPIFIIIVLFDFIAFSYSSPYIKLRNRAYWDWIFVFLWKGIVIAASYVYFFGTSIAALTPFMYGTLAIIMLFSWINQIDNQVRDFEVDKLNNTGHSAQRLGLKTSSLLQSGLLVIFFASCFAFCYFMGLYITMVLIIANCSLYYFVAPQKHSLVLELANIWVVVMFLEHFIEHYSFQQQLLFSTWVVAMGAIAVIHAKRCNMFETA